MNNFFFIFLIFFSYSIKPICQDLEFYGAIKLNGKDEQAITYKLNLTKEGNKVNGYSITDLAGEHETKSKIIGTYDEDSKLLKFKETGIIYTKSPISKESFCFIHYEGKIKLNAATSKINGKFQGKFKDNKKCIDGTIELVGTEKVTKLLNKINTRIQKSDELDVEQKEKYDVIKIFDSLQVNQMMSNQNLNIFNNSRYVTFEIWDHGNEDGDIINFYHNDKLILENFIVKNKKHQFSVQLINQINIFKIEAVNQGTQGLNTAMLKVTGDNVIKFLSNLSQGETSQVTFIKE